MAQRTKIWSRSEGRGADPLASLGSLLFGTPAGPGTDADFADEVRHEIVRSLYLHAPGLQLLFVGATLIVGALLLGAEPLWTVTGWMLATLIVIAFRLFLCRRYAAAPRGHEDAPRWALLFAVGTGISGLTFGSAPAGSSSRPTTPSASCCSR